MFSDDVPCGAWKAFVRDLCDHTDVGVDISCSNKRGVYVGNPELAESGIESG